MSEETPYERLYSETSPSVVSIYVDPGRRGRRGAGSGFVYDEIHVVTNHHVVAQDRTGRRGSTHTVDTVDVRFDDGAWSTGRVVGTDPYTDLAVVAVETMPERARPLPVATDPPTPGTSVAALGNPMGLDGSITRGIVSGANRSMATGEGFTIPDTVQTDAPINPGNSGGPLVTTDGAVVGVNRARAGDNIGFAISAAVLDRVVPKLIEQGFYRHPFLKIRTMDVSPTIAEANDLANTAGVLVVDVSLGPASGALFGCERETRVRGQRVPVGGDVITGIDGHAIDSHEQLLRYLLLETAPGEPIEVELRRDGERITETITLGERPATDNVVRID